jgi:hypothetical protein
MNDDLFYVTPNHTRCSVHPNQCASYEVKRHDGGHLYRLACSESCALRQKEALERAWEKLATTND